MLLRIFFVVFAIANVAYAGPVTKIAKHSNDLTEAENIVISSTTDEDLPDYDTSSNDFDKPKIYDDVAHLEIIPKPRSNLTKRVVVDSTIKIANSKHDLIAYVSKNIASEIPEMNLTENAVDLERIVGTVLKLYGKYYDKKASDKPASLDDMEMMSDQPMNDDSGFKKISVPTFDEQPTVRNAITSSSERPTSVTTREDVLNKQIRKKARDMYLNAYKSQLLANFNKPDRPVPPSLRNLTISLPQSMFNNSDSQYTKKIRSFYPICDVPKNTKDAWNEENMLNLFFNVDYNQNTTIATATLRLHRLPRENQTDSYLNQDICPENTIFQEEEKLIRVSIYWYTKSSKKHSKVKKRLCDSKVINENAQWVELSVKSATKMWTKSGKNMGLAILVEDQEGGILKASKYFKGATCTVGTVGTPTPRPIPTFLTDTAKQINDSTGIFTLLGFNKTGSIPSDFGLLPKIDVCVLELPGQIPLVQLNRSDCKLNNSLNEFDLSILTNHHHHIRHQKHLENEQEAANNNYDVRKNIINKKIILSKDLLEKFNNGSINR